MDTATFETLQYRQNAKRSDPSPAARRPKPSARPQEVSPGDTIIGTDAVGDLVTLSLDASPEQLDGIGRGEIDWSDHNHRYFDRNRREDPEQAFRRGMQQGAHRVYHAIEEAGVLDEKTLRRIAHYYGIELFNWRYAKRRRLGRRLNRDCAPWLDLRDKRNGRRR